MAVAAAVVLIAVVGVLTWRNTPTEQPAAAVSPAPIPARPSTLYASDGSTLIARFDTSDPHQTCLGVADNSWGFYCDYLVSWWAQQPAFGVVPKLRLAALHTGGYRIVGSLDAALQSAAAQRTRTLVPITATGKVFSLVSVQPGTGLIRTMAVNRTFGTGVQPSTAMGDGGTPYVANQREVTYGVRTTAPLATGGDGLRGFPGAQTFELFTIAAALEQRIPLGHTINTEQKYISQYVIGPAVPNCDQRWCPQNVGDPAYLSGKRDMWQALAHSVTTYFVPLQERVGADRVAGLARRLGITLSKDETARLDTYGTGASLGFYTVGVSETDALDLATAYATLAADGTHCDPLPVQQVTDASGQPVAGVEAHCEQVVQPDVARAAMDAARCPVGDRSAFGERCGAGTVPAGSVRSVVGRPVAGQFGVADGRLDLALAVASPQLVTSGMLGFGTGRRQPVSATTQARMIRSVAEVEQAGLASQPVKDFTAPPEKLAASD